MSFKFINSKYANKCSCCEGAITEGQRIAWSKGKPGESYTAHVNCHNRFLATARKIGLLKAVVAS